MGHTSDSDLNDVLPSVASLLDILVGPSWEWSPQVQKQFHFIASFQRLKK